MTTLVDVARRAGVSKSTVSNVIRGDGRVAETTRERVERAIEEIQYRPNVIARSLKARSSMAIGIIVPDLTNPFHAELAAGAERAANASRYAALITHTEASASVELEAARAFIERRVDCVVVAGVSVGSSLPTLLLDRDIPVVVASFGEADDPRLGVIDNDDLAAMELIVDHLFQLGHRRMTFVGPLLREQSGERRRLGFAEALRRRELADVGINGRPTAIAAHNDMQAIAIIDRLERDGRIVPRDVSVTGYDDIPLASHSRIQLTTVHADAAEMGRRAVELALSATREGRHVAHREIQTGQLIVRATAGRAPA
jgi:LacI family transcriptional regulator, galactose operon repressor